MRREPRFQKLPRRCHRWCQDYMWYHRRTVPLLRERGYRFHLQPARCMQNLKPPLSVPAKPAHLMCRCFPADYFPVLHSRQAVYLPLKATVRVSIVFSYVLPLLLLVILVYHFFHKICYFLYLFMESQTLCQFAVDKGEGAWYISYC